MTIYIRCVGEHPPREQWKREWDLALFWKPMGDQTSMAYWSDILHCPSADGSVGAKAIRSQTICSPEDDSDLDVDQIQAGLKIPAMACPHVFGLVAAFLSVRRLHIGRPDDVKKIVLENCRDLGRDLYHPGAGMPNLMKMLTNM